MKNCNVCGTVNDDSSQFCENCGSALNSYGGEYYPPAQTTPMPNYGGSYTGNYNQIAQTVVSKTQTSATIWMVIGILQIILGIIEACFGYGIVVIAIGIWNIINAGKQKKNAIVFQQNPAAAVNFYESQNTMTIVFLFVNFFLGSLIGVIASIYDLTVISYVKSNRNALLNNASYGSGIYY